MSSNKEPIFLKNYQASEFLIESISLCFTLDETQTIVDSVLSIKRNPNVPSQSTTLVLDGEELSLQKIELNDNSLAKSQYSVTPENLTITNVPDEFTLGLQVQINPTANTALSGLYLTNSTFCTQCESQGFRRITYFLDRPDVMATYRVKIIADKNKFPVMLSNGNCLNSGDVDANRHYIEWEDPFKKPSYLFALVAGDLAHIEDTFTTASGRDVTLKIFAKEKDIDKCSFAIEALTRAMTWDEQVYGREYDLDLYHIVAVEDFNMGAMENKSLNVFNAKYILASPQTATDSDFEAVETVVAHEYFHNWTGNRITCRDWFQLSLKEGLTVFREQEFSRDTYSRDVNRIKDVMILRSHQFPEDSGPMAHPVQPDSYIEINNFYTMTIYIKGAEVIRALYTLLGKERFRKGTDLYFERYDGMAVTIDEWLLSFSDANNIDLTQFKRWYKQSGTPVVTVTDEYHADSQIYRLHVTQACAATPEQQTKAHFHIPLQFALMTNAGESLALPDENEGSTLLEITEEQQTFEFLNVTEKPIPSLFRGFSAPVKYHYDYTNDELFTLLAHDTDGFAKWEAGQQLYMRILTHLINNTEKTNAVDIPIEQALSKVLKCEQTDKALTAKLLTLPSYHYIADSLDQIDVDGICRARKLLHQHLQNHLETDLNTAYHALHDADNYQLNYTACAARSLKNTVLLLLREEGTKLATQQYDNACNMTDTMAALKSIVDFAPESEASERLSHFYKIWEGDNLVIDKWFTLQAQADNSNVFNNVKSLTSHPAFHIKNPNRVRSLLSAFAGGNPQYFHDVGGEPYEFLCDYILQIDSLNPQLAARLAEPFTKWRRYNETRQKLMKEQLQKLQSNNGLSKDVFEIASKSLEA